VGPSDGRRLSSVSVSRGGEQEGGAAVERANGAALGQAGESPMHGISACRTAAAHEHIHELARTLTHTRRQTASPVPTQAPEWRAVRAMSCARRIAHTATRGWMSIHKGHRLFHNGPVSSPVNTDGSKASPERRDTLGRDALKAAHRAATCVSEPSGSSGVRVAAHRPRLMAGRPRLNLPLHGPAGLYPPRTLRRRRMRGVRRRCGRDLR
jgi:hypothetical protein